MSPWLPPLPPPELIARADGLRWDWRLCPGCGRDWWLGSLVEEARTAAQVQEMAELLGACADCRERAS